MVAASRNLGSVKLLMSVVLDKTVMVKEFAKINAQTSNALQVKSVSKVDARMSSVNQQIALLELFAKMVYAFQISLCAQLILSMKLKSAPTLDLIMWLALLSITFGLLIRNFVVCEQMELESISLVTVRHAKIKALYISLHSHVIRCHSPVKQETTAWTTIVHLQHARMMRCAHTTGKPVQATSVWTDAP